MHLTIKGKCELVHEVIQASKPVWSLTNSSSTIVASRPKRREQRDPDPSRAPTFQANTAPRRQC
ncbi:hypothetical protein E2C01_091495 [Portunus trituberculatus]|uniref:Uncharacterized protein n=1 Tax=Portunus trituberculatus TaxID=210409 RepID=A0A5B7JT31_PORTR|nr:hypothetical protein [Portunus trituberculatus]